MINSKVWLEIKELCDKVGYGSISGLFWDLRNGDEYYLLSLLKDKIASGQLDSEARSQ